MFSWILLIVIVAAVAVFGTWVFGRMFGRGELLPPMEETQDVIASNRKAIEENRVEDVRLEVVPRGYRQDQVDALIAQLLDRASASANDDLEPLVDKKK
ncbi:cell division protein DivIVA [Corynebacterium breve]|uniref:Cell division protein DivIVA n=1 Tax=Corynebacterium breve TaxID=3049799 RepID=A0ABY8VFZ8_9CORY|nr:cell division protein DivIVA [Corynebacterium breve]WIM68565.1 cell division protein DivIVA [Corynebacterium breve]